MTMTGPGGVGKTRLALQVATDAESTFADGAYFVPLAPLDRPADVAARVAGVLRVAIVRGNLAAGERLVPERIADGKLTRARAVNR